MLDLFRRPHRGAQRTEHLRLTPRIESLEDRLAPAIIGGTVYADVNANGLLDTGEQGIAGSTIQLQTTAGAVLASTTSDQSGHYLFTQLNPNSVQPTSESYDAVFSATPTNTAQTVSVPQFNPSLGTLTSVDLIATGSLSSNVQLENLSPTAGQFTVDLGGTLSYQAPGASTPGSGTGSSDAVFLTGQTTTTQAPTTTQMTGCENMGGSGGSTGGTTTTSTATGGAAASPWWETATGSSGSAATGSSTPQVVGGTTTTGTSSSTTATGSGGSSMPGCTNMGGSDATGSSATGSGTMVGTPTDVQQTTTALTSSPSTQLTANLPGLTGSSQNAFSGSSSQNLGTTNLNGTFNQVTITDPGTLQAYTGTGTVNVSENATANTCACGPGNLLAMITTMAQGDVKVVYNYTPSNALAPGQYNVVQVTQPAGYTAGLATGNNVTPIPGSNLTHTIPVTLNSTNDTSTNNNFAELQTPTAPPNIVPSNPTPNVTPTPTPDPTTPQGPSYKFFLLDSTLSSLGW
jgi:hypothetical protein